MNLLYHEKISESQSRRNKLPLTLKRTIDHLQPSNTILENVFCHFTESIFVIVIFLYL